MTLQDNENDLGDSLVLQLPNINAQITQWESLSLHDDFLIPTAELVFRIAQQSLTDKTIADYLLPGGKVQLTINGKIQFTGYIIKRKETYSRSAGTILEVTCHDILAPVIRNNINPQLKFKETNSVLDVLAAVLVPFGITKIYNDGLVNVNVMTGKVQKPLLSNQQYSAPIPTDSVNADGSLAESSTTINVTNSVSSKGINPSGIKVTQLKPTHGETAYTFLDKMLKRFGLAMWAAADGSGVIVGAPDFTSTPTHSLVHSVANSDSLIEQGELEVDWDSQPSVILGEGAVDPVPNGGSTPVVIVMVNEITGTDLQGNIVQPIKDIIAQYPGCVVLPLRNQLLSARTNFAPSYPIQPMYVKDKHSQTINQVTSFVKRKMATFQNKAFVLKYTLAGLSYGGVPFATNSMINVADDILPLSTTLWVREVKYSRSRVSGSNTEITMVLPFTIDLTVDENS